MNSFFTKITLLATQSPPFEFKPLHPVINLIQNHQIWVFLCIWRLQLSEILHMVVVEEIIKLQ